MCLFPPCIHACSVWLFYLFSLKTRLTQSGLFPCMTLSSMYTKDEKNHRKTGDSGIVKLPTSVLPLCLARMGTVYPLEAFLPCLHHFWPISVCWTLDCSLLPSRGKERIPFPREWVLVHKQQRRDGLSVASAILWGQLVVERRWLTRLPHILQGPTFRTCLSGKVCSSRQTPGRNVDRETKKFRTRARLDDGLTSAKQLKNWVPRAQLLTKKKGTVIYLAPAMFWELDWLFPPLFFFSF